MQCVCVCTRCCSLFTLGPIGLAAVCVSYVYVKEALAKLQNEAAPSYTFKDRNSHRRVILIIIGFLFFSPTSVVVFQTFVCETFEDGTQALVADSSVECYTTIHVTYIVYACFMVLIYPIGNVTLFQVCHLVYNSEFICRYYLFHLIYMFVSM